MPMSPRLLRPRAGGIHPDAQDWRSRVISNGGTVSASTFKAVSDFCRSITAAGIRDRFYRLNLFCGTGLAACLVPLYRGQSRTGTQFGNATDTNNGPFVSGDYVETGSSRGLQGNASKYLNTGLAPATVGFPFHMSYYAPSHNATFAFRCQLGAANAANTVQSSLFQWVNTNEWQFLAGPTNASSIGRSVTPMPKFFLGSTDSTGAAAIFVTDTESSTGTLASYTPTTQNWFVFTENRGGTPSSAVASDARISAYSLGLAMTTSQAASLRSALVSFQSALGLT